MLERPPISETDPSLPDFHFSEKEKEEMLKKGMTEEEIAEKEAQVRNRIVQSQAKKAA